MGVNRVQLMNELQVKLVNDREAYDDFADVGRQVEFHWKAIVTKPGEHYAPPNQYGPRGGYATGAYEASIERWSERSRQPKGAKSASGKSIGGQFVWHTIVLTQSPIAHFLEYGTVADPPGTHAMWTDQAGVRHKSPNTPTPAFAWAAQVERDFRAY